VRLCSRSKREFLRSSFVLVGKPQGNLIHAICFYKRLILLMFEKAIIF
jgi:hypothetical protein